MTRLNQSRRQNIGLTYNPQTRSDVTITQTPRYMTNVIAESFMRGEGITEKKPIPMNPMLAERQAQKITFVKPILGSGYMSKSNSEPSISDTSMTSMTSGKKSGQGIDSKGNQKGDVLPGDMLRQKLLKKMTREKKMSSLGDRVKTTPLSAGFQGGGQSMSKTLPDTKNYKLNPKPLVGAGKQKGGFIIASLIAIGSAIAAAVSSAGAVAVGATTLGTLAGSALTAAVPVASVALTKKLLGSGILRKKVATIIKDTRVNIKDLSKAGKKTLLTEYKRYKEDPSHLKTLIQKMTPFYKKELFSQVAVKVKKDLPTMKGNG